MKLDWNNNWKFDFFFCWCIQTYCMSVPSQIHQMNRQLFKHQLCDSIGFAATSKCNVYIGAMQMQLPSFCYIGLVLNYPALKATILLAVIQRECAAGRFEITGEVDKIAPVTTSRLVYLPNGHPLKQDIFISSIASSRKVL